MALFRIVTQLMYTVVKFLVHLFLHIIYATYKNLKIANWACLP